jgi:beta-aspartyl-peptidase (threonine type)
MTIGLIVHGGAGEWKPLDHAAALDGCRLAVQAGLAPLLAGASALDAVEAAVRALEANPIFNAGFGSVLNRDNVVEMDALVMDGRTHQIGAVAAVQRIEHPVSLARLVMERTPHHLLAAAGAELFATEQGMPLVAPEQMIAPNRLSTGDDTVGAVALDAAGNLAVAVSTGGIRGKLPGRVGDSPIAGAGAYADNRLGAACATGVGEGIMRSLLTFRAVSALEALHLAQTAAESVMSVFGAFGGLGGLIMIDRQGRFGVAHNTPYMPVAWSAGQEITAQIAQPDQKTAG